MFFKTLLATTSLLAFTANAGIYVGAEVNSTGVDATGFEDFISDFSDRSAGYGITAGYNFGSAFAVEAQYIDSDDFNDNNVSVDLDGWTVSGIGFIPLSETWSIYGEVGYFDFSTDLDLGNANNNDISQDLPGEDGLMFGGGVSWNITESFSTRLGVTLYDAKTGSINQANLGLIYEF